VLGSSGFGINQVNGREGGGMRDESDCGAGADDDAESDPATLSSADILLLITMCEKLLG
jgi:hypothetical protein